MSVYFAGPGTDFLQGRTLFKFQLKIYDVYASLVLFCYLYGTFNAAGAG